MRWRPNQIRPTIFISELYHSILRLPPPIKLTSSLIIILTLFIHTLRLLNPSPKTRESSLPLPLPLPHPLVLVLVIILLLKRKLSSYYILST